MRFTDNDQIRCSGCGHTSEKDQGFRSLSVNLPSSQSLYGQPTSLERLINKNFEEEDLSGHRCDNCGKIDMTSKTTQLSDLPPYLVISLNRSQILQDEGGSCYFVKNQSPVSITSEGLDLANYCDPLWASGDETYKMCGFVQHVGGLS